MSNILNRIQDKYGELISNSLVIISPNNFKDYKKLYDEFCAIIINVQIIKNKNNYQCEFSIIPKPIFEAKPNPQLVIRKKVPKDIIVSFKDMLKKRKQADEKLRKECENITEEQTHYSWSARQNYLKYQNRLIAIDILSMIENFTDIQDILKNLYDDAYNNANRYEVIKKLI